MTPAQRWTEHLCWACDTLVLICWETDYADRGGLLYGREHAVGRTNPDGTPHVCALPVPEPAPVPATAAPRRVVATRPPPAPPTGVEVPRLG